MAILQKDYFPTKYTIDAEWCDAQEADHESFLKEGKLERSMVLQSSNTWQFKHCVRIKMRVASQALFSKRFMKWAQKESAAILGYVAI